MIFLEITKRHYHARTAWKGERERGRELHIRRKVGERERERGTRWKERKGGERVRERKERERERGKENRDIER